jgi:hypothetical protein
MEDEIPQLEYNQPVREEKNNFILSLGEKCVESRLQQVLSVNPKTWMDLKNKGVIPHTGTNGEFLTKIFTHYFKQEGLAAIRVQAAMEKEASRKSKFSNADTESGLPRVIEAEKLQKIRLDKAREEEIHLRNLQTRSNLLDKTYMLELISPLIGNIANVLRSAADDNPKLQPSIDKCFISLFNTGTKLCEQADLDSERYVQEMLSRNIDLDELIENTELEVV